MPCHAPSCHARQEAMHKRTYPLRRRNRALQLSSILTADTQDCPQHAQPMLCNHSNMAAVTNCKTGRNMLNRLFAGAPPARLTATCSIHAAQPRQYCSCQ
eukprot:7347579-Alexandrium_andersonii.AAC.1